jgi:hypothetical protein
MVGAERTLYGMVSIHNGKRGPGEKQKEKNREKKGAGDPPTNVWSQKGPDQFERGRIDV